MAEETSTQGMATVVEIRSGTEYRVLMDGATKDCPATALGGATYVVGERVTVTIRNPRRPLIEGVEDTILPEETVEGPRTVPPRGSVMFYPFDDEIPAGWLKIDGSTYDCDDYPYLAAKFGATGATFTMPNYAGRMPVGIDPNDGWFPSAGVMGGEKTHVLTVGEMPSHNHAWVGVNDSAAVSGQGGTYSFRIYQDAAINWNGTRSAMAPEGGNQAHNNMPPYVCGHWIMKA